MSAAGDFLKAGDLTSARAALVDGVKRSPADAEQRYRLAEVLIAAGDWERADNHLDLVMGQDVTWGPVVLTLRQLIRAAKHRDEVFEQGRAPDLVAPSTPEVERALRILLESRTGTGAEALRREADEAAAAVTLERDGDPVSPVRDLDDRVADVLEVLTSTGKYVWAPWTQVISLEVRPAERLRDLVWRPAELELRDGPSGVVHIPMTYAAPPGEPTDAQRLGRETDWTERGGLTCGLGQRCLLLGDEVVPFAEVVALSAPAAVA